MYKLKNYIVFDNLLLIKDFFHLILKLFHILVIIYHIYFEYIQFFTSARHFIIYNIRSHHLLILTNHLKLELVKINSILNYLRKNFQINYLFNKIL